MAAKNSLFYDLITGENKKNLKLEKQATLLKQQDNLQAYNKKLSTYNANMAYQGAGAVSTGVLDGWAKETNTKNNLIVNQLNQKIRNENQRRKKRTLLNWGIQS